MAKANGIYERQGKSKDITYYIRYSYTYQDEEGHEKVKDVKENSGESRAVSLVRWPRKHLGRGLEK